MNKEELLVEIQDAKESYDEYNCVLGNELDSLEEKKRYYHNLLKEFEKEYGPISELEGQDIYTDWLNIKKKDKEKNEVEEWKKKYTYLLADFDNYKKRINKEKLDSEKYKYENIFLKLIEIYDELDLYYQNSSPENYSPTIDKIENILDTLSNNYGVELIYQPNKRPVYFNSEYDNAIVSIPVKDKSLDGSINKVIKKGFKYKDKILRYEQVIINKYQDEN